MKGYQRIQMARNEKWNLEIKLEVALDNSQQGNNQVGLPSGHYPAENCPEQLYPALMM